MLYDGDVVLGDLGNDTYVKDTFSTKRYTSAVINSFGHAVPMVAGQLQSTGKQAKAVTVRTEFSETRDLWEIYLTRAYAVPDLEKLTRTFIFERNGGGRVEIIDRVKFKGPQPQTFGTAIILGKEQKRENADGSQFTVRGKQRSVRVEWKAELSGEEKDPALTLTEAPIIGIVPSERSHGTRVGLDFKTPVTEATIHLIITPLP